MGTAPTGGGIKSSNSNADVASSEENDTSSFTTALLEPPRDFNVWLKQKSNQLKSDFIKVTKMISIKKDNAIQDSNTEHSMSFGGRMFSSHHSSAQHDDSSPAHSTGSSVNSHGTQAIQSVYVSGCSVEEVNGRYLESGRAAEALKYRNVMGWVLFRHKFKEIPDLGILSDNCYNAFEGPSMSELQDARAGTLPVQ